MVERVLTDQLIDSGSALLAALDESSVEVDAALWFYFGDIRDWRLILSLPKLIRKGPRAAYEAVQKSAKKLAKSGKELPLSNVTVAKRNAPLLELLKVAIRTGPGISGVRFTQNTINGQLIEDAYIYRLL